MKKYIFFISILLALLLSSNLATLLGLGENVVTSSSLLLSVFLLYEFVNKKVVFADRNMPEQLLIIAGFVMLFISFFVNRSIFKYVFSFLWIPYTLSAYLSYRKKQYQDVLRYAIYCVLIIQIIIVIYERVTLNVLLANEDQYSFFNADENAWSFRASGLYGHPLVSAMILSVINIFILYSSLNLRTKLFFFFFILLGLLCLNERFNIIITVMCSFPFIYNYLKRKNDLIKIAGYLLVLVVSLYSYLGLSESDYGGRLFHVSKGFWDESSQYRLMAFDAFTYIDKDVMFWGFGDRKIELGELMYAENGFVNILLQNGLILGIPLIILLMYFLYKKLRVYDRLSALIIAFVFLGIGFTNPHLSTSLQWLFWIVSYYAFCPSVNNLHSRYQKKKLCDHYIDGFL